MGLMKSIYYTIFTEYIILNNQHKFINYSSEKLISKIIDSKQKEIIAGVDGFLIYDIRLVPHISKVILNHYFLLIWYKIKCDIKF